MIPGMDRETAAPRVALPLLVVLGLVLAAFGVALRSTLTAPLLAAFLLYLLFPYRRSPWALRTMTVVTVAALVWVIGRFGWVLLILGVSLFLAYVLNPAVLALERRRIRRGLAILLLLIPVVGILAVTVLLLLPPIVHQLGQIIAAVPDVANRVQEAAAPLLARLNLQDLAARYGEQIPKVVEKANEILLKALTGIAGATRVVGSLLAALALVPFCTFYFLRDYDRVRSRGAELIPRRYHPWFAATAAEMDRLLGRWLRGVAVVALIVGTLTAAGNFFLGIPYALALGALAALLNFLPVVGFWVSLLVGALVGLTGVGWVGVLRVAILYFSISFVEGQFLSPRIVGHAVGLHPMVVLLALIVFADMFGILGAFLAVPLTLVLAVAARQLHTLYLASDMYRDETPS